MTNEQKLLLKDVRTDGGTQQRPIDATALKKYVALAKDGTKFPPVNVCKDDNGVYWLYDGFHRLEAYKKLGWEYVQAEVEPGSKRDAKFYSFAANKDHGVPRPPGTVKRMLMKEIFPDSEWSQFTDKILAEWLGVTTRHVRGARKEYEDKMKKATSGGEKPEQFLISDEATPEPGQRPENYEKPLLDDSENEDSGDDEDIKSDVMTDSVGEEIPEHLQKIFKRAQEGKAKINALNAMKREFKEGVETQDPLYTFISTGQANATITNLKNICRTMIPYAVCRYCMGNGWDCRVCNGQGWVDKLRYETTAEELK
jgi:hypothetical protein